MNRLTFTALTTEHIQYIYDALLDGGTEDFYTFRDIEELSTWVESAIQKQTQGRKFEFVLFHEKEFIGMISPEFINSEEVTIGLWITEKHKNKGYAKEALLTLNELLVTYDIKRIVYETEEGSKKKRLVASLKPYNTSGLNFILDIIANK